jgi:hypothetical protein
MEFVPMNIDFGKTAYVSKCTDEMLDAIENYEGLNPVMTGEGLVMLDFDSLEDGMSDIETDDGLAEVEKFLLEAIKNIRKHELKQIGDVVFSK